MSKKTLVCQTRKYCRSLSTLSCLHFSRCIYFLLLSCTNSASAHALKILKNVVTSKGKCFVFDLTAPSNLWTLANLRALSWDHAYVMFKWVFIGRVSQPCNKTWDRSGHSLPWNIQSTAWKDSSLVKHAFYVFCKRNDFLWLTGNIEWKASGEAWIIHTTGCKNSGCCWQQKKTREVASPDQRWWSLWRRVSEALTEEKASKG